MSLKRYLVLLAFLFLLGCQQDGALIATDVIFAEQFVPGEMGAWQIEGDSVGRTAVIDEQLIIEVNAPQTIQFSTLTEPQFTNFIIETDARQLLGDPSGSFGILFRMQGPNQFYRFEITGEGNYILERRNADSSWTRYVDDWSNSEAINKGINATNRLRVEAIDRNIAVYANGVLLAQVSDNLYPSGSIALDAGTFISSELKVAFDNVTVRSP
ncbi:MAG: family 16 glycoside hydrolase [Chloroflexota bacterium]